MSPENITQPAKRFVSTSELGRILNLPETRVRPFVTAGVLIPDQVVSPRLSLFDISRLDEIRQILSNPKARTGSRAMAITHEPVPTL